MAEPPKPRPYTISITAWMEYGEFHLENKNWEKAEESFRKIIKLNKKDAEAWHYLGVVLFQQERFKEAAQASRKSMELELNDMRTISRVEILYQLALSLEASGQHRNALDVLVDAFNRNANFSNVWAKMGDIFLHMEEFGEAEKAYRHAVHLNPNLAEALANLSIVLLRQRNLEDAREFGLQALALDPLLKEKIPELNEILSFKS